MSKLKKRSVPRDKYPIYDIKLTEEEYCAILQGQDYRPSNIYSFSPKLKREQWWRIGRTIIWQKGMR